MYLLNAHCEKSMAQEVQVYFKSYREFVNCKNDRVKVIISALNVIFPKGKDQVGLFPPNSIPKNYNKSNEHLRNFDMDKTVDEINKQGSYKPPNNKRHRSRSPETSSPRERHRYDVTDRR